MARPLTARERDVAILMIRNANPSPTEEEFADFTPRQRDHWGSSEPITQEQRRRWEDNLAEVVVSGRCTCGTCPTVDLEGPHHSRSAVADTDAEVERIVLDGAVPGAMILLFIDDDVPSCLELAPIDDDLIFAEFPDPESIEI